MDLAESGCLHGKILEPKVAACWMFSADIPEEERVRMREHLFGHILRAEKRGETSEDSATATGQTG